MQRWERRLADLERLLESCHTTYFDPNLFRMNINSFLQTARTVTFLINKQKANIPDFESWHATNIVEAWNNDDIMRWSVQSRNHIEKEGDLDMHSSLDLCLIFVSAP